MAQSAAVEHLGIVVVHICCIPLCLKYMLHFHGFHLIIIVSCRILSRGGSQADGPILVKIIPLLASYICS